MDFKDKGGRKMHKYWKEGGYEPRRTAYIDSNGKKKYTLAAFCPGCKEELKNTSEGRMRTHR